MGNALADVQQNNIPNDIIRQIATNVNDIDLVRRTNNHFANILGEPEYEFRTDTVTPNNLNQRRNFITKLIVTMCNQWPKLDEKVNYSQHFPHLKHLVLQSCVSDFMTLSNDNIASLQKLLNDCSPKLESIELSYIKHGHSPIIEAWTEMMKYAQNTRHLKLTVNVFPTLRMPGIKEKLSTVDHMHIVLNPEAAFQGMVSQGYTRPLEFLWNWATTETRAPDTSRSLTLDIPEWTIGVQKAIDFRCTRLSNEFETYNVPDPERNLIRQLIQSQSHKAANRLSQTRSDGLASFTLSAKVQIPNVSSTFEQRLLDDINNWPNTIECFIKPSTNVTLNFRFIGVESTLERPLLTRLMHYTTTRASTVHINIAIPQERGNHNSLFPIISHMYRTIYTQPQPMARSFGGIVLTIRIVGQTLADDRMHIYNESVFTSNTEVAASIETMSGDILHV
jgi:hypothetical protein